MKQKEAFDHIAALAEDLNALVISDIGSQSLWLKTAGDRDENLYLSGPMGMSSSVALGVAVANPDRWVIAACGDGALGMNMSSLATISNVAPANLIVAVINNGIYEYTRSLPVPTRGVDWDAISQSFPGFKSNTALTDFTAPKGSPNGPHFIHALVEPGELPPGPGLHAINVHHRFKALCKTKSQKKT